MMDRIDLHIEVTSVPVSSLMEHTSGEHSVIIRQRVIATRQIQLRRFAAYPNIHCNAQMTSKLLQRYCKLDKPAEELLQNFTVSVRVARI